MLKEKEIVGRNLIFLTNILVITSGFFVLIDQHFFQRCLFTKKLDEADEHFDPGASVNKINFYNKLLHYEKK